MTYKDLQKECRLAERRILEQHGFSIYLNPSTVNGDSIYVDLGWDNPNDFDPVTVHNFAAALQDAALTAITLEASFFTE